MPTTPPTGPAAWPGGSPPRAKQKTRLTMGNWMENREQFFKLVVWIIIIMYINMYMYTYTYCVLYRNIFLISNHFWSIPSPHSRYVSVWSWARLSHLAGAASADAQCWTSRRAVGVTWTSIWMGIFRGIWARFPWNFHGILWWFIEILMGSCGDLSRFCWGFSWDSTESYGDRTGSNGILVYEFFWDMV